MARIWKVASENSSVASFLTTGPRRLTEARPGDWGLVTELPEMMAAMLPVNISDFLPGPSLLRSRLSGYHATLPRKMAAKETNQGPAEGWHRPFLSFFQRYIVRDISLT